METLPHAQEIVSQEPLFIFSPPAGLADYFAPRYAIYGISLVYWVDLLSILLLQVLIASIFGYVIYRVVIQPRDYESTTTLILVYGFILPFWMSMPIYYLQFIGVRNLIVRFVSGCLVPVVSMFRATEAAHGFAPEHCTRSARDYVTYYASLLVFSRDEKGNYIRCSWRKVAQHGYNFLGYLVILGLFNSIVMTSDDVVVFGGPISNRIEWYSPERYATWELYANNMIHAVLFQLYLTTYAEGMTLVWTSFSGYQVDQVMKNPMFESKSPSDFWSRRWNLLVHRVLKGGVYKPVRKHASISLACLAVFVTSGLFHEYLIFLMFYPLPEQLDSQGYCEGCFSSLHGYTLAFFIWQAFLILCEIVFGRSKFFQTLARTLPSKVRTMLVIFLGLPLAHMFSEPYARSNFFQSGLQGVPRVFPVE